MRTPDHLVGLVRIRLAYLRETDDTMAEELLSVSELDPAMTETFRRMRDSEETATRRQRLADAERA